MKSLTIVDRELRVAARRGSVHRIRFIAGILSVLILAWFLLVPRFSGPAEFSSALFKTLAVIAYLVAALGGFAVTSDCLSEERREGTLGLLFLTDLRGIDVVLGKLAATSLGVIYSLLAIFPILAISILSGGVSAGEFGRVVLSACNLLFFSLTLGLLTSVLCREGNQSLGIAFLIMALFTVGIPLGIALIHEWWGISSFEPIYLLPSPSYFCALALDDFGTGLHYQRHYILSLITTHLIAWGFLIFSMAWVGRTWQDRAVKSKDRGWRRLWHGSSASRLEFRRLMLDQNAYSWRAALPKHKPKLVWFVFITIFALYLVGYVRDPGSFGDIGALIALFYLLNTLLKLWVAIEAPRALSADKQSGALELLLVTSLTEEEIAAGHHGALVGQFAAPASVLLLGEFCLMVFWPSRYHSSAHAWEIAMILCGMIVLVFDLMALSRLTPARSLQMQNENRAVISSVIFVMGLPWAIWFGVVSFLGAIMTSMGSVIDSSWFLLLLWAAASIAIDLAAIRIASRVFPTKLRSLAAARYTPAKISPT